jgi:hypothetical protein
VKIFISYSSKDRAQIVMLAGDLDMLSHSVWYDQDLTGGQKWWDAIMDNLRTSDVFIFGISPDSIASRPCQHEYTYAHALGKPIIPVLLNTGVQVALLDPILQERQFVNYIKADKEALAALNRAINAALPAPPLPNPLPAQPPLPISPLGEIRNQIQTESLSDDQQITLFHRLKTLFNNPNESEGARILLKQLQKHPALRASVYREIVDLLASNPTVRMKPVRVEPDQAAPASDPPADAPPDPQMDLINETAPPDSPDRAALHIRRAWAYGWMIRAFNIYLNNVKVGEVRNNSTVHFTDLKPGEHVLQIRVDTANSEAIRFRVAAGDHAFFSIAPYMGGLLGSVVLKQLSIDEYIDMQTGA